MRRIPIKSAGVQRRTILRVTALSALATEWQPGIRFLIRTRSDEDVKTLSRLLDAGLHGVIALVDREIAPQKFPVVITKTKARCGDVVAISPERDSLEVLYRESDVHHTVFLTNRCNSRCLMCSQPPTRHDDSWLIDEAQEIAAHIRNSPDVLGFTGGEPLLLGRRLRDVLNTFHSYHPSTEYDVLTNGRLFSNRTLARELVTGLEASVSWMVPLYGHADFLHDYVVQAEGAFDETIDGLLTLQSFRQPIQLRIVLIAPVLRVLPELCSFIGRNLPFVREVALMGCEPVGLALANREQCQVDIGEWQDQISIAVDRLLRFGIPPMIMNLPLCSIREHLRPYAYRSISDWKQVYAPECSDCHVRDKCSGLFAWHERGWRPTQLRAIKEVA